MKKNRLLTFLLALIPGCGHMYLGYMKKGLQFMLMFVAAAYLAYLMDTIFFDWITILFLVLLTPVWFYQMFDAMHTLTRLRKNAIEMPEDDGFFYPEKFMTIAPVKSRSIAKGVAIILIVIGIFGIIYGALNNLHYLWNWEVQTAVLSFARRFVTPAFASIALIVAGIWLLKGNKKNDSDISNNNGETK